MKTYRIGVVGITRRGTIARSYLPPGVAITAVADIDQAALDGVEEDVFKTRDYKELLARKDVDGVFLMTRDPLHEEMGVAALKAGKAVYLEKPMAITIEGCDRLLEAAYRSGAKLFLGHNMRYMPVVLKMKEIIDAGLIGKVQVVWCRHFIGYGSCYFRHWCSERANTTGLLLQKGAHDIDVIHWLSGACARRVVGMGKLSVYDKCPRRPPDTPPDREIAWRDSSWPPLEQSGLSPIIDIEDSTMIMMELSNGVQASYQQCFYTPDSERNYTFIGTHGRIENIGDHGACEVHAWTRRGPRATPDVIYKLKEVEGGHGGADPAIVKAFIEFARDGVVPNTSPIDARNAVAVGVLGHESLRGGNLPKDIPSIPRKILDYFHNGQKK